MKDYKIIKEWQFSMSKLFKEGAIVCLTDEVAKEAMKKGYIEKPKKKSKKIKKDGRTNSTTNN